MFLIRGEINVYFNIRNQVAWALVVRSSFQGRIRRIPGSILWGNNVWPVRMPLPMSRISRPRLVGRKPVRKPKNKEHMKLGECIQAFLSERNVIYFFFFKENHYNS